MTMAPGMEVASSSNPDAVSPHAARSPTTTVSTGAWYPPPGPPTGGVGAGPTPTDPRGYTTDHMMMSTGASLAHRGASPPGGVGGPSSTSGMPPTPLDSSSVQHSSSVDGSSSASSVAFFSEASRYYQMHQAYENAATQGEKDICC